MLKLDSKHAKKFSQPPPKSARINPAFESATTTNYNIGSSEKTKPNIDIRKNSASDNETRQSR